MSVNFTNAKFVTSRFTEKEPNIEKKPEFLFIGKSNVGKSSLINKICNRKNLARTGQTPGKTISINYFDCNDFYLVDLPGYGYAKRSHNMQNDWDTIINSYFDSSSNIKIIFFLVDSRHELTEKDIVMFNYLLAKTFPFCIIGTKSDKLTKAERINAVKYLSAQAHADIILSSSETGEGIEIIKKIIIDTLEGIKNESNNK